MGYYHGGNSRRSNRSRSKSQFSRSGQKGRSAGKRGGKKHGQYIDPARFVKAAKPVEHKPYQPENKFSDFPLNPILQKNLTEKGFDHPTQIQDQSISAGLEGKDVVGIANTGTGKTAAFLLPTLTKLAAKRGSKVIIMAPTRELAMQIQQESRQFSRGMRLFDVLLIGGAPMHRQLRDLKKNPEIIIGTPGRIKDHLERRTLKLDRVTTVVLDEVDRMLDMGFINDIREILSHLPTDRQSLFYSATMSPTISNLIDSFSRDAVTIMARTAETSDNVEQSVVKYSDEHDRMNKLRQVLDDGSTDKSIIFCETKYKTDRLSKKLSEHGHRAVSIHGGKSQGQRQRALKQFKQDSADVLVATDVAARGIDVDGITHVINYEEPQTYDDYTHRIGRTGRGDSTGHALTFLKG